MSHIITIRLPIVLLAMLLLVGLATEPSFAHARYERSEPAAQGMVDGTPFVLKTWFNQELMSASTIKVVDAAGNQVDLGDGRVDLDDVDRKLMVVSLPELPVGVYTVAWASLSAEDGDWADGTFTFGVGMIPPTAHAPLPSAGEPAARSRPRFTGEAVHELGLRATDGGPPPVHSQSSLYGVYRFGPGVASRARPAPRTSSTQAPD